MNTSHSSYNLLDFYIKEGISPVYQDISNLNKHFQIRANLYRLLGLIPSFLKGKDIIEVGPGSGHNSIYTATLLPRTYELVEPNPVALKDIAKHWVIIKPKTQGKNLQFELKADSNKKKNDIKKGEAADNQVNIFGRVICIAIIYIFI